MPVVAADPARAVMGEDHPAAPRGVIARSVAVKAAAEMVMMAAEPAATTAAMKAGTMEASAAMEATAAATTASAAMSSPTMSSAAATVSTADFGDQRIRSVLRDGRRGRADRGQRLGALRGRHHQHCHGCDAHRLAQAAPEIGKIHHA
jgi:hypothetical protein